MIAPDCGSAPINGLHLYYEVYGELSAQSPPPLLLIPGAFMGADAMPEWVDHFAAARPVITFDQQGHGRTPDTRRDMSFGQFADDAAALLRALGVGAADVMGYSQGGGVALQVALRHPELVNKLVVLSATYRKEGLYPVVPAEIAELTPATFAGSPIEQAFKDHTPDDAAFGAYIEKMKAMAIDDQRITDDQMRSIAAPTMVIAGDADMMELEHVVAMFKLRGGGDERAAGSGVLHDLPAARLAVLPACSHLGLLEQATVVAPMVTAFLDDVPPTT